MTGCTVDESWIESLLIIACKNDVDESGMSLGWKEVVICSIRGTIGSVCRSPVQILHHRGEVPKARYIPRCMYRWKPELEATGDQVRRGVSGSHPSNDGLDRRELFGTTNTTLDLREPLKRGCYNYKKMSIKMVQSLIGQATELVLLWCWRRTEDGSFKHYSQ